LPAVHGSRAVHGFANGYRGKLSMLATTLSISRSGSSRASSRIRPAGAPAAYQTQGLPVVNACRLRRAATLVEFGADFSSAVVPAAVLSRRFAMEAIKFALPGPLDPMLAIVDNGFVTDACIPVELHKHPGHCLDRYRT